MAKTKTNKRTRRTSKEMFLDTLKTLSNNGDNNVSNKKMLEALGWSRDKYDPIKDNLVTKEQIITGRGHGGTINLPKNMNKEPLKLFVSYSHSDEEAKDQLLKHLTPLKRLKLIEEWHDRKINPGEEWGESIDRHLISADIILLIISIDFINSKYCYDIEMMRAIERHEEGSAHVIPIIYRNCLWHDSPFAKLQALPRDAAPISSWSSPDDAYANVASGIKAVTKQILADK